MHPLLMPTAENQNFVLAETLDYFSRHSHQIGPTARDDADLETIGTQIIQHVQHALRSKVRAPPLKAGMRYLLQPIGNAWPVYSGVHPCVCRVQYRNQASLSICFDHIYTTIQYRCQKCIVAPLRMLRGKSLQFIHCKHS